MENPILYSSADILDDNAHVMVWNTQFKHVGIASKADVVTGGTPSAEDVSFTPGDIAATDVQAAIEEVEDNLSAHVDETTNAHAATSIGAYGVPALDADGNLPLPGDTIVYATGGMRIDDDITISAGTIQAENNLELNTVGGLGTVTIGGALMAAVASGDLSATDVVAAIIELAGRVAALEP